MPVSDVPFQSAAQQSGALAAGEISSRELVEIYLERIAVHNTALNAVVTLDPERARREAGEADAARAAGQDLGPLHGLPITVKDSYETAGMRTSAGAWISRTTCPIRTPKRSSGCARPVR